MKYETAKKRKNACITAFLILVMWAWGGLRSHVDELQKNPETGFLFLGLVFGLPMFILFSMIVFYSIKAKQAEFDELDDELDDDFDEKTTEEIKKKNTED